MMPSIEEVSYYTVGPLHLILEDFQVSSRLLIHILQLHVKVVH